MSSREFYKKIFFALCDSCLWKKWNKRAQKDCWGSQRKAQIGDEIHLS
jgi:hypothetical protein